LIDKKMKTSQVHVHLLPRKAGDFANNDDVYTQLSDHDKGPKVEWRSLEEMVEEASLLKNHLKNLNF